MRLLKWLVLSALLTASVLPTHAQKKAPAKTKARAARNATAHNLNNDQPALQLQNLDGATQKLSDYRGQIVVLNFWAEWCGPCRREMPLLKDFAMIFGPQEVQFIAASVDDTTDLAKVKKFAADYELDFPVWVGATKDDMTRFGFASSALPATVILDRQGRVAWRYTSVVSEDDLRQELLKLIRQK